MRLINQSHWVVALLVSERFQYVSCVQTIMCADMDHEYGKMNRLCLPIQRLGFGDLVHTTTGVHLRCLEGNGKTRNIISLM